jgi:hypothetical protein
MIGRDMTAAIYLAADFHRHTYAVAASHQSEALAESWLGAPPRRRCGAAV